MKAARNGIKEDLDDALKRDIQLVYSLPPFLTPKRVLQIFLKTMKAHMMKINEIAQDAIQKRMKKNLRGDVED